MNDMSVSVIIPTWNRADTIKAAVLSALNQTNPPLEVLVCDDGSSDDTEQVVHGLIQQDARVKWLPGPRGGRPAIPRNRGISHSRGEWVAFLDSDDEWLPTKLERQFELLDRTGCRAACSNALRLVPNEGVVGTLLDWQGETLTFDDLLAVNNVVCCSALVHRSVLDSTGGFSEGINLRAVEDYALWLRVATQTDFAYVAEPQVLYRDDAPNSVRAGARYWPQRYSVLADLHVWLKSQHGKLINPSTDLLPKVGQALGKARRRSIEVRVKHAVRGLFKRP